MKRVLLCLIALMAVAIAGPGMAQTAWRPEKVVELVVPTAPGGINDQVMRVMQKALQDEKLLSAPAVVMNKPGGNQALAVSYLNQHARDPHFLLYTTPTIFTNQLAKITSQLYTDLTPVALLYVENTVFSVRADSPLKTMRDLVAQLKSDPESIAFGLVSRGGPNHLALSQAVKAAGIDPRKIKAAVFKTNAESITALIGGHLQAVASSVSAALAQAQAGNIRMLAMAAPQRMTGAVAGVPTLREQGIDVSGVSNWRGIFAPKGIAPGQIAFWEDALGKTVATADWKSLLEENSLASNFLRSAECAKYLERQYGITRAVMADLGLTN
jgi:putative tricarboxylic transport membrane protein